jgi:hypothetical protein
MLLIWYNPDIEKFQSGTLNQYDALKSKNSTELLFEIFYEFNATSGKLISRVLDRLNHHVTEKILS